MTSGATKQYELTSVWDILNDVISTNLTDPAIPKRQKSSEWIKNGFPNPGDLDKKEGWKFPLVIINPSELSSEILSQDNSIEKFKHNVSITVHSKTNLEAMQMSEEIKYILTTTGRTELIKAAIQLNGINGTSSDFDFTGSGNKFFSYTIDYNFQRVD